MKRTKLKILEKDTVEISLTLHKHAHHTKTGNEQQQQLQNSHSVLHPLTDLRSSCYLMFRNTRVEQQQQQQQQWGIV